MLLLCTAVAAVRRLLHPLLAVPSHSLVCALSLTGRGPWQTLRLDSMASREYCYGPNLVWNASLNVPLLRLLTATSSNLGTDAPFDVSPPHPPVVRVGIPLVSNGSRGYEGSSAPWAHLGRRCVVQKGKKKEASGSVGILRTEM